MSNVDILGVGRIETYPQSLFSVDALTSSPVL